MTEQSHDRRGALVLAVLGLAGLGFSSGYSFTSMTYPDMALVTAAMGLSFALLIAAALRGGRGRTLPDGTALVTIHQEVGGRFHHNLLRFLALALDAGICAALAGAILVFLDEAFPRGMGDWYQWATDANKNFLEGMELWRSAWSVVGTSEARAVLGPMLATGLCGIIIFVPAAWWGATPGMLICGFRWLRAKDGGRVGALHAFLRFLAMALCAAPQAALMVLGTMFGMQKMKVVRTGRKFLSKRILMATWKARRTIADLVSRTETLRPAAYVKPKSQPAQGEDPG
jgi:hypothetical protein